MNDFAARNIVITGGTGALGTATAGMLLEAGAVCHIPALTADEAARFPHRKHERVHLTEGVDLTSDDATLAFYKRIATHGPLWASIHIAGGFDMAPIEETTHAMWTRLIEMNATTCFLCCREAVRVMKSHPQAGGRIVNIAARPALRPEQGGAMAAYTASKAAVAALTSALAAEVLEHGILINAVAPSIMDTPANRAAMPRADHAKWPRVHDVAGAIACLISPANVLTSGTIVPVYGRS